MLINGYAIKAAMLSWERQRDTTVFVAGFTPEIIEGVNWTTNDGKDIPAIINHDRPTSYKLDRGASKSTAVMRLNDAFAELARCDRNIIGLKEIQRSYNRSTGIDIKIDQLAAIQRKISIITTLQNSSKYLNNGQKSNDQIIRLANTSAKDRWILTEEPVADFAQALNSERKKLDAIKNKIGTLNSKVIDFPTEFEELFSINAGADDETDVDTES